MAAIFTIRYPEDRTGTSQANRVLNEPHELPNRNVRAIAPLHGPFYVHNLTVRDKSDGRLLTRGVDYEVGEFYDIPSARSSKTVCAIILITNTQVSSLVELDYNVYGGEFSYSLQALVDMLEAINLNDRPVNWPDIINIPTEFNPAAHLHDVGDVYGFEYIVTILDRLREAILIGDAAHHDSILDYVDRANDNTAEIINTLRAYVDSHVDNENNPHNVTRDQLDVFSRQEVLTLINDLEVATEAKIVALRNSINAHVNIVDGNPHGVTADMLGVYTKTAMDNLLLGAYLPLDGSTQMTGRLTGATVNMAMTQDSGASGASFTCRASGTGDDGLAGMMFHNNAYAIKMGVRSDGTFGIGGYSRAPWSMYSDAAGNLVAAGNVSAYSDPRLKEKKVKIDSALSKTLELNGYYFNWKHGIAHTANKSGMYDIGFMSDEVKKIVPMAVNKSIDIDDEAYDIVSYEKIIPLHNEAIRELHEIIVKQQKTIDFITKATGIKPEQLEQ